MEKLHPKMEQTNESKWVSSSRCELLEAFQKEGCFICRLTEKSLDQYFTNLLYELVNDPGVSGELRKSFGYCPQHTN